jgi:hypothetical protein
VGDAADGTFVLLYAVRAGQRVEVDEAAGVLRLVGGQVCVEADDPAELLAAFDDAEARGWVEVGPGGAVVLTDRGRYWLGKWEKANLRTLAALPPGGRG